MYILIITVIIKSPHGDLSIVLDEHRARTAHGMKGISTSLVAKAPAQKWEDPDLFTSLLRAHTPTPPPPAAVKHFVISTSICLNYLLQNKHHFR